MMNKFPYDQARFDALNSLTPCSPDWFIDWDKIWTLWPELEILDDCPQDPVFHAEGDVGTHTRMVVEALVGDVHWRSLEEHGRSILFWAAILHDIGKPATTKHVEGGRITSRGHSRIGAAITRKLLWFANAPFHWREAICGLISSHQLPFWLIERPDPIRLAIQTSWQCNPHHLCLHAIADAKGRICDDQQSILDNVALAQTIFEENSCLNGPFAFANDESRVTYFEREDRDPYYTAHENFRCDVTIMAGLPGVGKDTWISRNLPELPVVSLDGLREELDIAPTGNQGIVIQAARERAREYLRTGQDFVWNATNVTWQNRARTLRLLRDYNARIHIVYLETGPEKLYEQNNARCDAVPKQVIDNLLNKLEPPLPSEAHEITYVI